MCLCLPVCVCVCVCACARACAWVRNCMRESVRLCLCVRVLDVTPPTFPPLPPQVILLFTAHSLPVRVIEKGDAYSHEVHSTVSAVVSHGLPPALKDNPVVLGWQSKVGFLPWLTPSTGNLIKQLGAAGHKCARGACVCSCCCYRHCECVSVRARWVFMHG